LELEPLNSDEPDSVLVQRAGAGDGDGFTELCRRYYAAAVAIGHAILGDRHLAEDAAQQALAKAAVNLPRLRRAEQFGRWLAAICRNEARDLARARQSFRRPALAEPNDDDSAGREVSDAVKAALGKLSPLAREVVYLRYYDGLSYEQISNVLGISEQAINGRLRRAKRKLAEHLRRDGFGEVQL
jgi:RNA polymerase sigma-70 factor (ECF subfamily)